MLIDFLSDYDTVCNRWNKLFFERCVVDSKCNKNIRITNAQLYNGLRIWNLIFYTDTETLFHSLIFTKQLF